MDFIKDKKNIRYILTVVVVIVFVFLGILTPDDQIEKNTSVLGVDFENTVFEVSSVIDGDTIEVENDEYQFKVRLLGIDTPETKHPNKAVECFGIEASSALEKILSEKEVYLVLDDTQDVYDRYQRVIAYIYTLDDTNINKYMIEQGYAYEYTYDNTYKYQKDFQDAEDYARENGIGLWDINTCNGKRSA